MPERPDHEPSPPGGRAAERLREFREAREPSRGTTERPPGGRAWERRRQFALQRGLTLDEEGGGGPAPPGPPAESSTRAAAAQEAEAESSAYIEAAQAPPGGPAPQGPAWEFLGPAGMANGQTYGVSRVTVSGRIAAIAIDPSDSNHILAGAAGGGIWESRDRGATWAPRTDSQPTLTTGAVAFDPARTTTVYAGTGEGNFYSSLGAGVLRSTDGGATWSVLASAPFVGQGFFDLLVGQGNTANVLLAATTRGLYQSTDGGGTWSQRRAAETWSLSGASGGGAMAEILAGCGDGIYRSTDGGTTWTVVNLPGGPPAWSRVAVALAPSNPATAYLWGAVWNTTTSSYDAHFYRRDATGVWQAQALPPGLNTGQAWYDWYAYVAPDNPDQVYLGAIDIHRGDLSGGVWSWLDLSTKSPSGDSIHPDQHALAFDPHDANTVYAGSDGGLFRSPNRGVDWVALNDGLGITEVEYIAQDFGSSRWLLGGTQDNGSIRWTGGPWEHVADGDGGGCGVDRVTPSTVFHTFYGMGMQRSASRGDFGSWTSIGPGVPAGYQALFYPPAEADSSTVAQAGQSVFISRDDGSTWNEVALAAAGGVATTLHIPGSDELLVGTNAGQIFRLNWSGTAWSATQLTQPRAGWVSDVFVDTRSPSRLWATYTTPGAGRVFRSDDGGATWHDCTAGLPNLPINAVAVDTANGNRVWVSADLGVYQSLDAGAHWARFGTGLPNALVEELLFQPWARVLRCATRNRGVWQIPVDGRLQNPICGVQWRGSLPAGATNRWFTYNWPATWTVAWTVMPTTVKPGAPEVTWNVQIERASSEFATYWITVTNLTGVPVDFEGRYCILSYY